MVTAAQLQILQSPITALISTVSTSVNVKLDDTNYLNWHFQMQLLLESYSIYGFVDGSHPCPSSASSSAEVCGMNFSNSSSTVDCDEQLVWKMHDRAIMQLLTATLSPIAMSCAIGSTSSRDLWVRLKEQFSSVSKTTIFQLKSDLQNIRKGTDSISQYLLKIKETRDYLSAAGVYFGDEDIVILALNGLPSEYNTFRCVVRGRENVISLQDFRSQLLAEEKIVDTSNTDSSSFLTAMHTTIPKSVNPSDSYVQMPQRTQSYNNFGSGGYRSFNRPRGRGRYQSGFRNYPKPQTRDSPSMNSGVSNPASSPYFPSNFPQVPVCQLCNFEGHTAPMCVNKRDDRIQCNICGRTNHTSWFCYYNNSGPNSMGSAQVALHQSQPSQDQHLQLQSGMTTFNGSGMSNFRGSVPYSSPQPQTPQSQLHQAMYSEGPNFSSSVSYAPHHQQPMQAMNTVFPSSQPYAPHHQQPMPALNTVFPSSQPQPSSSVWLADSGATNHMSADLSNLSLVAPYPANDRVQTANGEGQGHGEDHLHRTVQ